MNTTNSRVQSLMNQVPASVVEMIVKLNQEMETARHLDNTFTQVVDQMKGIFENPFGRRQGNEYEVAVNNYHNAPQVLLAVDQDDPTKTICCTIRVTMVNEKCNRYRMDCRLETRVYDTCVMGVNIVKMIGNATTLLASVTGVRDEVKSLLLGKSWDNVHGELGDLADEQ